MGEHEGAARGDYYIAYPVAGGDDCSEGAEEGGFGRIYAVGPGGDAGLRQPSEFHFQSGSPSPGVRMEEFAMHGLRFALQPSAAIVLAKGDLESTFVGGSLFEAGYDLTRWIPFLDEILVRGPRRSVAGLGDLHPVRPGLRRRELLRQQLVAGHRLRLCHDHGVEDGRARRGRLARTRCLGLGRRGRSRSARRLQLCVPPQLARARDARGCAAASAPPRSTTRRSSPTTSSTAAHC